MVLLFLAYSASFLIFSIKINLQILSFFGILLFLYFISGNLKIKEKPKYKAFYINILTFLSLFFIDENYIIFSSFLIFSLFQIFFYKICKRFSYSKSERYSPNIINIRNSVKTSLDVFAILVSIIFSFMIKFSLDWQDYIKKEYILTYLGIFLLAYTRRKMYKKSWSYTNVFDVKNLIILNLFTILIFSIFLHLYKGIEFYKTILIVTPVMSTSLQLFNRFLFKLRKTVLFKNKNNIDKKRVLIYGAGEAGTILAREYMRNPAFPYEIIGFIDDSPKKIDSEIYGVKVLGNKNSLIKIVENENINEIIIALPSASSKKVKQIIEQISNLENIKVKIQILPKISEILYDKSLVGQIREVKIEDLLCREEILINDENISSLLENKVIFVTGGAGSIGSELCRQIAKYKISKLIILDINENNIYFLSLELKRNHPELDFEIEICNIRELDKLEFLFNKYRPNIIFHAAAHKHVPLMEHNPEEAIKNNIFGTRNVAKCADKFATEKMVLISTDKAVNPTNLMGASKRACELIIADMNKKSKSTKYMAVRFGNVLGSNGSVIPIFKELISKGKNLTLTHKDITRYFMTIPEATQLVIEAGSLGRGGEIFILDMGEPVKIYDLAKSMIKLSNADVGIDIVGLRPGEKLFEELLYDTSTAIKTENKKIFITKIEEKDIDISSYYGELEEVIKTPDIDEIKKLMKKIVVSYKEANYN